MDFPCQFINCDADATHGTPFCVKHQDPKIPYTVYSDQYSRCVNMHQDTKRPEAYPCKKLVSKKGGRCAEHSKPSYVAKNIDHDKQISKIIIDNDLIPLPVIDINKIIEKLL